MSQSNGLAKLFGLAGLIPPILCLGADIGILMIALGVAIALSPLVDRAINTITPPWWMGLRVTLSLGLGGLTIVLGVVG